MYNNLLVIYLLTFLALLIFLRAIGTITISDSELIVKQLNGQFRLKNDELRRLFHEVKDKERAFERVIYKYVSRNNEYIKKVDMLANNALDGR